jgi:hypothetical protein
MKETEDFFSYKAKISPTFAVVHYLIISKKTKTLTTM